jgi:hypothetical protein
MNDKQKAILVDRALEQVENWGGTLYSQIIQMELDSDDWEGLAYHVNLAERQEDELEAMADEFYPNKKSIKVRYVPSQVKPKWYYDKANKTTSVWSWEEGV